MDTLFIQKKWPESKEDNNGASTKWKNSLQKRFRYLIEIIIKIYLQVLFTMGAFMGRSWVDKHIKLCYNRLDEINSNYDKETRTNWYPKK